MLENSGVYMILCRTTGEFYVGGTKTSFEQRFREHRNQLRRGACLIPKLQAAYNQHGEEAFEYRVLKDFPPAEVDAREKEALTALQPALNTCYVTTKGKYRRWDKIVVDGASYSIGAAARKFRLEARTIRLRVERGLTGEALVAPAHKAPRKPYVRRR